jgi:hypothetical protein
MICLLPVRVRASTARYAENVGRLLISLGLLLCLAGLVVLGAERLGIRLGHLPGDIRIQGKRGGFYFPIATCIVISALLSLLSWLLRR